MSEVVGVDWARPRWLTVRLTDDLPPSIRTFRTIVELLEELADADAIAVDIPIGLPEFGPWRRAEREAVELVSRATIFPTFPAEVYEATSHSAAVAICRARGWQGISQQSYRIWKLIEEVGPHALRVREVHPEVSFWAMHGKRRLRASKHTWNGLFERRRLLANEGIVFPDLIEPNARPDDVLDAAAAAWTARRIAAGTAGALPARREGDEPQIAY